MKYVYLTLNWLFGVSFLLLGVISLVVPPDPGISGLFLVAISLLLLPPVRKFAYSKSERAMSTKMRAAGIAFFIVGFSIAAGQEADDREARKAQQEAQAQQQKAAEERQEKIDEFNSNKDAILGKAESLLEQGDYQGAIDTTSPYLVAADDRLRSIHDEAKSEVAAARKERRTQVLLEKLNGIPVAEYGKNLKLYKELAKMHPQNALYEKKVTFYTAKIEERERKQEAEAKRKERIKSQFSPWDGSHIALERLIQQSMNDPDSYEHVRTTYIDKGDHLTVKTVFRGKNAFGGKVLDSVTADVSLDGQILRIIDN